MPSPKKKKKKTSSARTLLAFISGMVFPLFLVVVWHAAYGQQDTPNTSKSQATSQAHPSQASYQPDGSPAQARQPQPAVQPEPPQRAPAQPPVQEDAAEKQPLPSPDEDLAAIRPVFQEQVCQATLTRIDHYRKEWPKAERLQKIFAERRERLLSLSKAYYDFVRKDVSTLMAKAGVCFGDSQYFVYADRNPAAQFILVGFYDADKKAIEFLGADLASTGNIEKGGDYFETPTGVFENSVANFSYRALGTPNQEGWRGLGGKDSRVWDFGDQRGLKQYKAGNTMSQLRLLMHSTDPDHGEVRLGRPDSKGCVRISPGLNQFLDTHAILDRNYEDWAKTRSDSWLFRKDRAPVAYPGKYLIIGDSQSSGLFAAMPEAPAPRQEPSGHAAQAAATGAAGASRELKAPHAAKPSASAQASGPSRTPQPFKPAQDSRPVPAPRQSQAAPAGQPAHVSRPAPVAQAHGEPRSSSSLKNSQSAQAEARP